MDDLLDLNFSSPAKPGVNTGPASNSGSGVSGRAAAGPLRTLNGTPVLIPGTSTKPDAFDFLLSGTSGTSIAGPSTSLSRPSSTGAAPKANTMTPGAIRSGSGAGSSGNLYGASTPLVPSRNGTSTPSSASLNPIARLDLPFRPSSSSSSSSHLVSSHSAIPSTTISGISTQKRVPPTAPPQSSKSDAFDDLFSLSGGPGISSSSSQSKQSLADRQAQVEREKREKEERERRQFDFDSGYLDTLGGMGGTGAGAHTTRSSAVSAPASDSASISARTSTPQPTILAPQPHHANPAKGKGSFWETDFASTSSTSPSFPTAEPGSSKITQNTVQRALAGYATSNRLDTPPVQRVGSSVPPDDPFDLDALARATPSVDAGIGLMDGRGMGGYGGEDDEDDFLAQLGKPVSKAQEPVGEYVQDEDDDLLGELGKPVRERTADAQSRRAASPPLHTSQASGNSRGKRASSPPPHIIGQLVEMGYSPAQARQALAATANGTDVQGAVEILLSGIMGSGSSHSAPGARHDNGGAQASERSRPSRGLAQAEGSDEDEDEEADEDFIARERERERSRREREQAEAEAVAAERRRARRAGPSRDSVQPRTRDERERDDDILSGGRGGRSGPSDGVYGNGNVNGTDADKYIQQATAIGSSMLGKASTLWAAGKERAQKLYEEQKRNYEAQQRAMAQAQAQGSHGQYAERDRAQNGDQARRGDQATDARPRWMVDAQYEAGPGEERDLPSRGTSAGGGFRDDDASGEEGEGGLPPHPSERAHARAQRDDGRIRSDQRSQRDHNTNGRATPVSGDSYRSVKERTDSLFADPPRNYVPAHRRKPAPASTSMSDTPSRPASRAAPAPAPRAPPRAATPLIKRAIVTASPTALSSANDSKAKGNEHFKLGRFAEAETAYTTSISRLPAGHLALVALYNNRATARLKLGEWSGAVEDCSAVLDIIGAAYHPSKEEPLPAGVQDCADVKLAEGCIKAYTKRAQAREMGEKYKEALEDWEKVVALSADQAYGAIQGSGAGALGGVRRAKKMLNPSSAPTQAGSMSQAASSGPTRSTPSTACKSATSSSYTTRTQAKSASASAHMTTENSAGVSAMRAAAQAAAKENDERLAVQDAVDAKIASWKGGKETNLRALIASLETVLWPAIMGGPAAGGGASLKVGMHELISEKQVKVKYMRVVGRLHPDKLNTTNTTVEQRLVANAVFGALSEAWQAFNNGS